MNLLLLVLASCCIFGLSRASHATTSSPVGPDLPVFASCPTSSDDASEIYWSKPDGQRVEEDPGSSVYSTYGEEQLLLVIVEAKETDEGQYICWEANDEGETTVRQRFTFHLEGSPPWFDEADELIEAYEGTNVTLVCQARGDQPIEYSWLDQHSTVITDSTPGMMIYNRRNHTELHLRYVSNETSGFYTCVATNHLGTKSKLLQLVVHSKAGLFPPFFNESRESVYGLESESLELKCEAEGIPAPSYTWFDKFGAELDKNHPRVIVLDQLVYNSLGINNSFSSSSPILVSKKEGILNFTAINRTDSGNYRCEAENALGTAYKTYTIRVNVTRDKYPPFFRENRVEVFGFESQPLTLTCEADGNPSPQYTWYNKYGEQLNRFHQRVIDMDRLNDSSVIPFIKPSSILLSHINKTITFVQLNQSDAGHYTCYAENSLGRANKTFRVYVEGYDVPEGHVTVTVLNVTDSSVTFDLSTPNTPAARGFEAKYRLIDKSDWSRTFWSLGENYTVSNLLPGAKYMFQFKVSSSNNWTDPITVALPPGPPEIILRQVRERSVEMEFFRPLYLFSYNSLDRYIIKYGIANPYGGNTWSYRDCQVTITLPTCYASSYVISNLQTRAYYRIIVQAAGPAGSSEPSEIKVFIP